MAGRLATDESRRQTIQIRERGGSYRTVYEGPPHWPKPVACFDEAARTRVLMAAGLPLLVQQARLPEFWRDVEQWCRSGATIMQSDLSPAAPTASQVRLARAAGERLRAALTPFVERYLINPDCAELPVHTDLYGSLAAFVSMIDRGHFPVRESKPTRNAGPMFVPAMGSLYRAAFGRAPSEGPNNPFARFVLACLAETTGVPETVGGDWVRKHVRAHKRSIGTQGRDCWAPFPRPYPWAETSSETALSSHGDALP